MTDAEYENHLHNIYMKRYKDPIPYEDWNNKIQNLPQNYQLEFKDNFWDLSGSWFQNSLYWSKLWVVNPGVENPHRIFKGDVIKLDPLALSQVSQSPFSADLEDQFTDLELPPRFSKSALSEEEFPSSLPHVSILIPEVESDFSELSRFRPPDRSVISYYLSDSDPPKHGEIIGTDSYGELFGVTGEDLLLSLSQNAPKGSYFTVFKTRKRGYFSLEREVQIKALLKITDFIQGSGLYKAHIVSAMDGVSLEDAVFKGPPPSYTFAKNKFGKAEGSIIGSPHESASLFTVGSLVYLDKGSADGVNVEDSFYIIPRSRGNLLFERPAERTGSAVGVLKVIHAAGRKSTAVILSAEDSVYKGDRWTGLIRPIEVERLEESESLDQGAEFFEEVEEVEVPESFIDEDLQDPKEMEDEALLEEFESAEEGDDLFEGEIETEESFQPKDLDEKENENLQDEFEFLIEDQDLEDSPAPVGEELELEKEALEAEIEREKEISLKDENTDDESLIEEFEDETDNLDKEGVGKDLEEMELIEEDEREFIEEEGLLEEDAEEGFDEDLEGLEEEDLEELEDTEINELEEFEEIDTL